MKYLILIILVLAATAKADECHDLGRKYTAERYSMSIGELVRLRDCVHEQMDRAQREAESNKVDAAILKLWSKDGE